MLAPLVQHILRSGYKRDLHAFQGGQRHYGRFGTPQEENGGWGGGEVTTGEPALATSIWDVFYADKAGVVLQSSEQLKEMIRVIVVVCAAFALTILEAKTEIIC